MPHKAFGFSNVKIPRGDAPINNRKKIMLYSESSSATPIAVWSNPTTTILTFVHIQKGD